jgi:magnesium chelatase subunit D
VLDSASIGFERDGIGARWDARIGVVICDEGGADDGPIAPALVERLAFCIDLRALSLRDLSASDDLLEAERAGAVLSARERLAAVTANDKLVQALCGTAMQLGVAPLRASLLALRAARASAALAGHAEADDEDGLLAARLVLAPRATRLPAPPPEADEAPPPDNPPPEATPPEDSPPPDTAPEPPPPEDTPPADPKDDPQDDPENKPQGLEDRLVEATVAALPAGLLAALQAGALERPGAQAGRVGALAASPRSGRPVGVRRGEPRGGARLNLVETLRAAAPWQRLRRAAADAKAMATDPGSASAAGPGTSPSLDKSATPRIYVNADDLRVSRLQQRAGTATLFVVDASGSAALQRLSEAKGAVNLLLADCYVRRDEVAVIAFRGRSAELLLAPTRSLVRAKRSLASLPGGGGTPLASGLEAALRLAEQVRRGGAAPIIVLLTDGRANIARDGEPGRARAEEDALAMARLLRAGGFTSMVVDTSPQPAAAAKRLAQAMAAQYRALPYAGAQALSAAVRALPRGAG